ncbi:MAG: DUF1697 domain-containing protein [Emcibacteraceae bacterium]|nr:DUF1697 domain-containing protein [Emcibacteraceae bacterium]MDG1859928.1 DUF1697 domain-containing protein [Emcibacteraceae bacterium]
MHKFIALLRGINVSGQKKIIMSELKVMIENLGFENVLTYIQSGNIIFEHQSDHPEKFKNTLENAIEKKYGFSVYIDVLRVATINKIFQNLPFGNIDLAADGSKVIVCFLSDYPDADDLSRLKEFLNSTEKLISLDKILYLHCPEGSGKSKVSNAVIERKLNVTSTARNLKTVAKLCELSKD